MSEACAHDLIDNRCTKCGATVGPLMLVVEYEGREPERLTIEPGEPPFIGGRPVTLEEHMPERVRLKGDQGVVEVLRGGPPVRFRFLAVPVEATYPA